MPLRSRIESRDVFPEMAGNGENQSPSGKWGRKIGGGMIVFIGFLLSPLSWWNDAFINLPLAVGFGWLVSLVYKPAFEFAVVFGYWATNLLGFFMMHKGIKAMRSEPDQAALRREIRQDLLISLAYTLLLVVLFKLGVLQPLADYWKTMGVQQ